jgi:hypothetical protein
LGKLDLPKIGDIADLWEYHENIETRSRISSVISDPSLNEDVLIQVLEQFHELAFPPHPESASPRAKI